MRTSNKILLGLLVIVFTVPLLLAASLKSKVAKGEYTVEKFDNAKNERLVSGSFQAFKVVKVVAPKTDLLTCRFRASNKMDYNYYKQDKKDSVTVSTINDTLVITYIPFKTGKVENKDENRDWERAYEVNVNLPAFNNLIVDGAVVIIDSFPAAPNNISVILKNRGEIKEGGSNQNTGEQQISGVKNIEKNSVIQPAKTPKADILMATGTTKLKVFKRADLDVVDMDIRDLLVYTLFYRI